MLISSPCVQCVLLSLKFAQTHPTRPKPHLEPMTCLGDEINHLKFFGKKFSEKNQIFSFRLSAPSLIKILIITNIFNFFFKTFNTYCYKIIFKYLLTNIDII